MIRPLLLLAGLSLVAACAPVDEPTPGFGNAVRQNIAAQVINPDPHPADMPAPEYDGARTKGAMDRYHEDKIKKPVPLGTSTIRGDKK